jgi:hypothetical protein
MRLVSVGCALGAVALTIGVQGPVANGQGVVQRTDPQAGSPAGVIYQIPLDTGRRDAAPVLPVGRRSAGGAGGGAPGSGGSGSSGTGSSGTGASGTGASGTGVAGATAGATGVAGAHGDGSDSPIGGATGESASTAASAGGGTPGDPSSIHSENGFGSSSQVPGVSPAAVQIGAGVPAAHTAGSALPTFLLIALIAAAAVAAGLITTRVTRHREPGDGPGTGA